VAFYGCKVTPEDVQNALLRVPGLKGAFDFALHPFEDDNANKRLEVWLEANGGIADVEALERDFFAELEATNQDFRESIRMVSWELRPRLKVFRQGKSPLSGQDPRIKKRYIV
jgi:hypothetical protein